MARYSFLGGSQTRPCLRGLQCNPVKNARGKCIVSQRMAVALVVDANGTRYIVPRRRLRLNKEQQK